MSPLPTQASGLLARQYDKAVKLKALIDSFQELLEEKLYEPSQKLKANATIEAKGYWLELLAKRFKMGRPYKLSADAFFFGFAGNPQSVPFSHAPFRPDGDTLAGKVPLGDSLFRKMLLATAGGLRTNGQQDSINKLLQTTYPGSFVVDNGDMTATLYLQENLLDDDFEVLLQSKAKIPKPCGITMDIEKITVFGFDGVGAVFDTAEFTEE